MTFGLLDIFNAFAAGMCFILLIDSLRNRDGSDTILCAVGFTLNLGIVAANGVLS